MNPVLLFSLILGACGLAGWWGTTPRHRPKVDLAVNVADMLPSTAAAIDGHPSDSTYTERDAA